MLWTPRPLIPLLAGTAEERGSEALDLQVHLLLRFLELSGMERAGNPHPPEAREDLERWSRIVAGSAATMAKIEDLSVPGPLGAVPIRVYTPVRESRPLPVLVYYHGGGWVLGGFETHDTTLRNLAAAARCVVVAVDYRLAPEHKFPAPLEDAFAAYRWVRGNVLQLGGDLARVAVGGDSAGGNLATVVAALSVAREVPRPCFQLLLYPVTDLSAEAPSYELFADGFFLSRDMMRWFRGHYLVDEAQSRDPLVSPLLAEDLSGLPPAYVATAGYDPLHDEGKAYAERLLEAGVEVFYRDYPGLIHGFLALSSLVHTAAEAFDDTVAALSRAFE